MFDRKILLPSTAEGSSLGILGGGQLGRMFVLAAHSLGYRTVVFDPDPQSPAGQIACEHICAPYEDTQALNRLIKHCAAVTFEFENVPTAAVGHLQGRIRTAPSPDSLAVTQNRIDEKRFIRNTGADTVAFEPIVTVGEAGAAFDRLSRLVPPPYILKSARWGYDGKHQFEVFTAAEVAEKVSNSGMEAHILEEKVDLEHEVSVIAVRIGDSRTKCYPVASNEHRESILHSSTVPADIDTSLAEQIHRVAEALAEALDYQGVLGVEFFIASDGRLLVNELAPRPHNSGHYTLDACTVSQFEQQVRVLCGLPIGDVRLVSAAVMTNLLGDLWHSGEPPWHSLLHCSNLRLHLYGKAVAKPGRKMGHFCLVGEDTDLLRQQAATLFSEIRGGG